MRAASVSSADSAIPVRRLQPQRTYSSGTETGQAGPWCSHWAAGAAQALPAAHGSKLTRAAQAALGLMLDLHLSRVTAHATVLEWWPKPFRLPSHSATPVAHAQAEGLVQISPCPDLWRYTFRGT